MNTIIDFQFKTEFPKCHGILKSINYTHLELIRVVILKNKQVYFPELWWEYLLKHVAPTQASE